MDRNSIIGLVIIFALMAGYGYYSSPSKEEKQKMELARKQAYEQRQATLDSIESAMLQAAVNDTNAQGGIDTNTTNLEIDPNQVFALAQTGEKQITSIENEVFTLNFSNIGGRISGAQLKDFVSYNQDSIVLFDEKNSNFFLSFFANNRTVNTKDLYFEILPPSQSVVKGNDSCTIKYRVYPNTTNLEFDKSRYLEFEYTIYGNQYMIGFKINTVGLNDLIAINTNALDLTWNAELQQYEKALSMEQINTAVYYKPDTYEVDYLSETKDDSKEMNYPVKWVSFKQQFFSVSLISDDVKFAGAKIANNTNKNPRPNYLKSLEASIEIPYNSSLENQSFDMRIYMGPNKYRTLTDYNLDLERQIPLGWSFFLMQWINRIAVIPTFDWLDAYGINYGIIILILTIFLKLFLFPIAYKSYVSSAKMRIIKPEVDELSKKYPKPEQAMEKQKAVMNLYKKAGANPMSGCIPMLLQFPILLAMFRFFPASIELRQQPFLWADDLSSYDSILSLPFEIPFYGAHVSLFALLMAISNLFYTRMTFRQSGSSAQMPGMKYMMYLMPIMFLGFLNSYSSALNYYYLLSTLFTFFQMWLIRQFMNDAKIHAKILEHKKKPVVKSKFQQRMEDMVKKQQQRQQNQKRK